MTMIAVYATLLVAACFATQAHAAVIEQTGFDSKSGALNFGQRFEIDSGTFASGVQLNGLTFNKGNLGGGSATLFIDIYAIGTANIATLNFSTSTETGNLSYLGSSSNSVDYTAATGTDGTSSAGDALTWSFAGIALPSDVALFAVFSTDATNGNWVGASINIVNDLGGSDASFTNIVNADSGPLFGGGAAGNTDQDNLYSLDVATNAVPTPAALPAGLALISLITARRRRRR